MLEFCLIAIVVYLVWAIFIHPVLVSFTLQKKAEYRDHLHRLNLARKRSRNDGSEWHNDPDI